MWHVIELTPAVIGMFFFYTLPPWSDVMKTMRDRCRDPQDTKCCGSNDQVAFHGNFLHTSYYDPRIYFVFRSNGAQSK